MTNAMLFLGCSLEKDKTLELFGSVMEDSDFDIPDHFAILPEPNGVETKNQKEARLNDLRIRTLWYPQGEHGYVENYIKLALDMATERLRNF